MNKNPKYRFATARDMQNALDDYLAGRPVTINDGTGNSAKTAVIAGGAAAAGALAGAGVANAMAADKTGVMPAGAVKDNASANQQNYKNSNSGQASSGKKKGSKKKKVIITLIILAVIAGIAAFFFFNQGDTVPDVVGKNVDEAKKSITDAGFEVGTIDKEYSNDKPENSVTSQNPSGYSKQKKGTKINLKISMGPEMITVPDVLGKTRSEAQDILERAGFKVKLGEEQYSKYHEAGKVMTQDPEGNQQAPKDSTITIIISKGSESISVPSVVNYSEASAISALRSAGFEVEVTRDYSDSVDEGLVISQNPSGSSKLDKGSTVTICVSRGSNSVSVPNVVGMTVGAARAALQNAGFSANVVGSSSDNDVVVSQSPGSGSKAKKGETITLTVKTA